jgi:hypothetical protein
MKRIARGLDSISSHLGAIVGSIVVIPFPLCGDCLHASVCAPPVCVDLNVIVVPSGRVRPAIASYQKSAPLYSLEMKGSPFVLAARLRWISQSNKPISVAKRRANRAQGKSWMLRVWPMRPSRAVDTQVECAAKTHPPMGAGKNGLARVSLLFRDHVGDIHP